MKNILILLSLYAATCTAQKPVCPTQTTNQFVLHHVTNNCGIRNADTLFMNTWVKVKRDYTPRMGDVVKFKNGLIAVIITKPEIRLGREGQEIYGRSSSPEKNGGVWVKYWYYKIVFQAPNCQTSVGSTTADSEPKYFTRLKSF